MREKKVLQLVIQSVQDHLQPEDISDVKSCYSAGSGFLQAFGMLSGSLGFAQQHLWSGRCRVS